MDPLVSEEAERHIDDAEKSLRRAMSLFPDCTTESLLQFAADQGPILQALGKAVGETAQHLVGTRFPGNERVMVVRGVEYERSRPGPARSGWRHADLWERVKDSSRYDPDSGERITETEFEKYRRLYTPGAPRLTVLDDYGVRRDEFCHLTWPEQQSWRVVPSADKQRRRK